MKKLILSIAAATIGVASMSAQQFDLTGEFRPRFENKHGFKTLQETDADGANFVSQRTRLNFKYKKEKLEAYVILQNSRVWGDIGTLGGQDNESPGIGTTLHEAWALYSFTDKFSLKMGRQEIIYDDQRIFGSVNWVQQARSHDAVLAKYVPNENHNIDFGLALNSDSQSGTDNLYSNVAGYKNFQYARYQGDFNKFGLSFLALNTGVEYEYIDPISTDVSQEIDFMQTIGPRLTYKSGSISADAATYFQTGKLTDIDVSGLYYGVNLGYKINGKFSAALGYEFLSGKDQDDTDADIKSFAPLFGTNHKFNGLMDYFYVGSPHGNVGLQDIHATFAFKSGKISAKLMPHLFTAAADVYDGLGDKMDASLGTEIDLVMGYKISKETSFNVGFSKMFATDTMQQLKGGDKDENNAWGWVMFTFKPKLFSYKAPTSEDIK